MPRRVPRYLKEISTQMEGPQQGDYAHEWGFAKGYNETDPEDAERNGGDYLGWWGRRGRDVYYFAEHQRPGIFKEPEYYYWQAYDWYRKTAADINYAFEEEEKVKKMMNNHQDLFSTNNETYDRYPLPLYDVPKVIAPGHIRNVKGIAAWLYNHYCNTEQFLKAYNEKAEKFNSVVRQRRIEECKRLREEIENRKKAAEDEKYNSIITQLGKLRDKIEQLDYNITQGNLKKDKEFSLFKSELTSKIPDQNLNVSRYEHDEDIAQLNERLRDIKVDMNKNAKKTDDSIVRLQKKVNVSMLDISKRTNDSVLGIKKRVIENEKKNSLLLTKDEKAISDLNQTLEKVQGKTLVQSNEIDNLRKDLQALGGEAREFIDNTKRQEQAMKAKVAKRESVVTRIVKKAAFPDLTKRPWLKESVTGRFFQLTNQW